ncbi:hypothetical protein HK097_003859 [Rhizophlyctis rosea]|uniref:Uncharacterized protein n=1 Tax=Rhizophlyctis rosea TaxID=64517 RepID=A0AAD5WZU0_9FUNG|nr:hypothetical protein HK097_003859 [Rhizophlyctis rosea]
MSSYLFPENSTLTLDFSYHNSSLSCWTPFYYAHITFAYLITIFGILAIVTRILPPKLKALHLYMGRAYILSMLWGTATSLLIHNTGLPVGVVWSFAWVMIGLSVGYIAITIHQTKRRRMLEKAAKENVLPTTKTLSKTRQILSRFFSWKTLHGSVMFVSWINIAGRTFVTPPARTFQCYTYPAFKPITSKHYTYEAGSPLELVPQEDPMYARLPWAYKEGRWAVMMLLGPLAGALVVGLIYLFITVRRAQTIDTHQLKKEESAADEDIGAKGIRAASEGTL